MQQKLLIATNNTGKIREYLELLPGIPFALTTPRSENLEGEVDETGTTFAENALLKALYFSSVSGLLTLADDSGLEVDALDGRPGIYSARYGGPNLGDEDRVDLLLSEMRGVPWNQRTGRFQCVIAIAWPTGYQETIEECCEGYIDYEPRGPNGFGYDPIFYSPELGKTFAEVESSLKHKLSHRGKAARRAAKRLFAINEAREIP